MIAGDSLIPDFVFERAARGRGFATICGIDEAGRGPWAGPVVAAAVILDENNFPSGLNDSKKLTAEKREKLFGEILTTSVVGIGIGDEARIDRDNILAATLWAMGEAAGQLGARPDLALVDGNRSPRLFCMVETIVEGDCRSLSIAAASIIAKVTRDRLMIELDRQFPAYGFAHHKGYGTALHHAALRQHGCGRQKLECAAA